MYFLDILRVSSQFYCGESQTTCCERLTISGMYQCRSNTLSHKQMIDKRFGPMQGRRDEKMLGDLYTKLDGVLSPPLSLIRSSTLPACLFLLSYVAGP